MALCPFCFEGVAKGKYHEFMITYGGCNVAGNGATAEMFRGNPYLRGALSSIKDPADARRILAVDPKLRAFWFRGEGGSAVGESEVVRAAKRQAGSEDRVTAMYEPFPPTLNSYREYERGSDLVILKNEEDPQANIMMAMGRGAGRTFGKPFGFYWEQTHYPFPSLDEKLHVCMLYYLSGGSWMSAETGRGPVVCRRRGCRVGLSAGAGHAVRHGSPGAGPPHRARGHRLRRRAMPGGSPTIPSARWTPSSGTSATTTPRAS